MQAVCVNPCSSTASDISFLACQHLKVPLLRNQGQTEWTASFVVDRATLEVASLGKVAQHLLVGQFTKSLICKP